MKKYGKFEKQAAAAAKKQPGVKSVLLQTYFTSLLSLVLCVTLFFGTSYAWFTSEVTNTANEIYVGTLDVGLYSKGGRDLAGTDNKLFDKSIRWEPGYTTLDTIQIANQGDLAFRYVLSFTDGSVSGGNVKTVTEAAKHFEVWVYEGAPAPESYADITEEKGWEGPYALNDLLAGEPVLSGEITTVRGDTEKSAANKGTTDGVPTSHTYTVALHMKESADADVMGARIGLNVKLVAYQMVSEEDVFMDKAYDDITAASDLKELTEKLEDGEDVVLLSGMTIGSTEDCLVLESGTLDGNGKTLTYSGGKTSDNKPMGVLTAVGGTVQNLTIKAGSNGCALSVTGLEEDLNVTGCSFSGDYAFRAEGTEASRHTVTFGDTYFETRVSYKNLMEHVRFNGCTFAQLLTPGGDTTLEDCSFGWASLDVHALESGETITLINCTYGGKVIEKAVLKAANGKVTVEGTDLLAVVNNAVTVK